MMRSCSSVHRAEPRASRGSRAVQSGGPAGGPAVLHRCVLQHSLMKVKLRPRAYFSPVTPHSAGRTQLFSYRTTRRSPAEPPGPLNQVRFAFTHPATRGELTFLPRGLAGQAQLPRRTLQREADAVQRRDGRKHAGVAEQGDWRTAGCSQRHEIQQTALFMLLMMI